MSARRGPHLFEKHDYGPGHAGDRPEKSRGAGAPHGRQPKQARRSSRLGARRKSGHAAGDGFRVQHPCGPRPIRQPIFITRITDRNGNVLADFNPKAILCCPRKSWAIWSTCLRRCCRSRHRTSHSGALRLARRSCGKTGTTQKNTTAGSFLCILSSSPDHGSASNDSRVTMRSNYWGEAAQRGAPGGRFFSARIRRPLIDDGARFPYARPRRFDHRAVFRRSQRLVRRHTEGPVREPAKPSPRRDLPRETPRVEEPPLERNRLDDALEQRRLERQTREGATDGSSKAEARTARALE